jgi:hypothetical protein
MKNGQHGRNIFVADKEMHVFWIPMHRTASLNHSSAKMCTSLLLKYFLTMEFVRPQMPSKYHTKLTVTPNVILISLIYDHVHLVQLYYL